jgi:hypothetical protein
MSKLKLYIVLFFLGLYQGLFAQVLEPFANGLSNPTLSVAQGNNEELFALTTSVDGFLQVSVWDAEKWTYSIEASALPKLGVSAQGELKVNSFTFYNNSVYLVLANLPTDQSQWVYSTIKYNNNQWTDISNARIKNASEILKLLVFNGSLVAIVKNTKDTPANIFYFENNEWVAKGNYLTPDVNKDQLIDAIAYFDKIYLTGVFTKIGSSDKRYIAEWNGTQWSFVSFPPFVQQAYTFGNYKDNLVLYGIPASGFEYIRSYDRNGWQNLSGGLDKINIQSINSFAWNNEMLWACGSFSLKSNQASASLMYYLPSSGWVLADELFKNQSLKLGQYDSKAVLIGDYTSFYNQNLNHISEISAFTAMIRGSVYHDLNNNCIKEPTELKRAGIAVSLNPGNHYFVTNSNGEFNIPVFKGDYTIKPIAPKNWEILCSTKELSINQNNTLFDIDLPIKTIANVTDVAVDLYDFTGWKAGKNEANKYQVCARNVGTTAISKGKLIVYLPVELENFTFNPVPVFLNADKAEWNLIDVLIDGSFCVEIKANLKAVIELNAQVLFKTLIQLEGTPDADISDNTNELTQKTVEFVGTNAKASDKVGIFNGTNEPLHYRILFQNTTGSKIQKLRIVDTLDQDIFIGAKGIYENTSHKSELTHNYILLPNGNYQYILNWNFSSLNLADSTSDFDNSKGFVDIKVYTDMRFMKQNAEICNKAYMYFENNEPLTTNKVCNTITNVGIVEVLDNFSIYPNPVSSKLYIKSKVNTSYTIYSSLGNIVFNGEINQKEAIADIGHLSPGIYIIQLNGIGSQRFVITK